MACDERIRDLLPDYYLGQLPEKENEEVRRHLASDPECRAALGEVERTLGLMPLAARFEEPPPDLKSRTIARAASGPDPEVKMPAPLYPPPEERPAAGAPAGRDRRPWKYLAYAASAAAAVLVVAFVALFAAYLDLRQGTAGPVGGEGGDGAPVALAVEGTERAPGSRGTVVMASDGMALDLYNLPAPPEGHSYHAWLVGSGESVTPLGEMEPNRRGDVRMTGELPEGGPYEGLEVTVEPDGSEEKSGPVYLQTRL